MRLRIAIIGTGISGLAAARTLNPEHNITIYEADNRPGGHAHTVTVSDGTRRIAVDTGFIVFNEQTYPNFSALLKELNISSQTSEMSFGVKCNRCGIEYSSRGLRGLFARRSQMFQPSLYRMAVDIARFNSWATAYNKTDNLDANTIEDLLHDKRFGKYFFAHYLIPMSSAIWSSGHEDVRKIPLRFFLNFFRNHGLLQLTGHPQWRTIVGRSQRYVEALVEPFRSQIRFHTKVKSIRRTTQGVSLYSDSSGWENYNKVVIATHTNQALKMLERPTEQELTSLSAIPYRQNTAILHSDPSVLPKSKLAWASWNYHVGDCTNRRSPLAMTYHLNRLQGLPTSVPMCLTLNETHQIKPELIHKHIHYEHPTYSLAGLHAQEVIRNLNGNNHTYYCGAYLGNGFHEDGLNAGLAVTTAIQRDPRPC